MVIMGIDPGAEGCVVCIRNENSVSKRPMIAAVHDVQIQDGNLHPDFIQAVRVKLAVSDLIVLETPLKKHSEHDNPITDQRLWYNYGQLRLLLSMFRRPETKLIEVSPQTWKAGMLKNIPIKDTKKAALESAKAAFGDVWFYGPLGGALYGRSDAANLALWGWYARAKYGL